MATVNVTVRARPASRRNARAGNARAGRRPPAGTRWAIACSLAPAVVLFSAFFLIPLGVLAVTSFADWGGLGFAFVGVENFTTMFGDATFWKAARNTAAYAAVGVLIQVPLGILVGIILAQGIPGWRVFRAIVFIPFVISGAAYAVVFSLFYNPRYGPLNNALGVFGLNREHDWLFSTGTALPAIAGTFVFILGFVVVLVMAEIAAIPRDLYQAAEMDGASAIQRQWHITVPLLRNVTGTLVLITLLGYLALFDLVFILTKGGPDDATVTLALYAYRAYANGAWGYANATGLFIIACGLLLIVLVRRAFRVGERTL